MTNRNVHCLISLRIRGENEVKLKLCITQRTFLFHTTNMKRMLTPTTGFHHKHSFSLSHYYAFGQSTRKHRPSLTKHMPWKLPIIVLGQMVGYGWFAEMRTKVIVFVGRSRTHMQRTDPVSQLPGRIMQTLGTPHGPTLPTHGPIQLRGML